MASIEAKIESVTKPRTTSTRKKNTTECVNNDPNSSAASSSKLRPKSEDSQTIQQKRSHHQGSRTSSVIAPSIHKKNGQFLGQSYEDTLEFFGAFDEAVLTRKGYHDITLKESIKKTIENMSSMFSNSTGCKNTNTILVKNDTVLLLSLHTPMLTKNATGVFSSELGN